MKNFLLLLFTAVLAYAAVAWFKPEWLPGKSNPARAGATREQELSLPPASAPTATDASPKLYRWTDSAGRLVFTDRPPTGGEPYVTVQYDPNVNVLPATPAPDPAKTPE